MCTFIFLKYAGLQNDFFLFPLSSLNLHAILHREVQQVRVHIFRVLSWSLTRKYNKNIHNTGLPFSLSVNGKQVSSMSSFKGFSEHFAYTSFNQFSRSIPVFFVISFYHIPSSHIFMFFGLPTIKRRHVKSVYQFKSYLYLKLMFVCWRFIILYAHWTIADESPRKCNYWSWIIVDIMLV